MATNGNFITTGYNDRCLKFEWELESQNSYTGVSTISWRLLGVGVSSQSYYQTSNIKVIIDDATAFSYVPQIALWEGTVAASGYYSFVQTSDGSKSFTVTVKAAISSEENCSGSGSWELPSIIIDEPTNETESTFELSATNISIGETITANITSSNSSYTHDVEFYLSGYGGGSTEEYYTKYTGVATSQSFTVPETWYNYMVSTDTCIAYCKVTTRNNGVIVGSEVVKPFTVKVLSSIVPTIGTMTLDPDDFTIGGSSYDYLVKGKNKLTLSVSGCTPTPGSKIESYTFVGPSINTTITTTNDSATTSISSVASYGELTYKVTIKDSRGHKSTIQKDISCYNYQRPYFTFFNASRNGKILTCTYTPSFSDINNKNTVTVKIYANDILVYTDENVENDKKVSKEITLNSDTKHDVYAIITDALGESSNSKDTETYGSDRILNLASDGLGLAVGKMSTQNGLECSWDAQFYGDVNISQSLNVDGDGNFDGALFVSNDITTYGGIAASGDITTDGDIYANNITASVLYGNVDGEYVDVSRVIGKNIIMSGMLYQNKGSGNKLVYGINSSDNLQVGAPGSRESRGYNDMALYAPGNIYIVPGGYAFSDDNWTVSIRNYEVDGVVKQGLSVNGNISCDGNMYISEKRVLTTDDLTGMGDTPEINNGHYHSGKTLKCIGITPKETDGSTAVDTFTIDATVVTGRVRPSATKSVSCGGSNYLWSTMYTSGIYIEGSTASDATTQDGGVFIKNLPTASNYGANVRIDNEGRLYKVDDSLVSTGGSDILESDNTFTGTNAFSKAVTMSSSLSVTGRITASSAIVPSANSSYALGFESQRWSTLYANNINISGEVYNEDGLRKYAYYSHTHDNLTATAVFG